MANILIACEQFGAVREAFRKRGHNAVSCDIKESEPPSPHHHKGYLEDFIGNGSDWYFIVAFPPCTFLCSSGLHWNRRVPGRAEKTQYALNFVAMIANAMRKAKYGGVLENPQGCISTRIVEDMEDGEMKYFALSEPNPKHGFKPFQTIQPYMFGHNASKATCLWRVEGVVKWPRKGTVIDGIPMLRPFNRVSGRMVMQPNGKFVERFDNQTDSGQNRLGPSDDRATIRGKTYEGIAEAMAAQYSEYLLNMEQNGRS